MRPQVKDDAPFACTVFPPHSQLEREAPSGTWLSITTLVAAPDPALVTVIAYVITLFFLTVWVEDAMATERLGTGGGGGDSDGAGVWVGVGDVGWDGVVDGLGVDPGLPGGAGVGVAGAGEWLLIGWKPPTPRA